MGFVGAMKFSLRESSVKWVSLMIHFLVVVLSAL